MGKLVNRAKVTTATTGTGTITLGSAVAGYQTFASAGVANGDVVSYVVEDNNANIEFGTGTYTSVGTTLSRTVTQSYISGTWGTSAINLSGNAVVYIAALAADLYPVPVANGGTGVTTSTGSGAVVLGTSPTITTPTITFSTSASITAGTNAQGQGALTSDYNLITTASNNPSGVTLPTPTVGRRVVIVNRGANPVNIYPASGHAIDGLSANASIQIGTSEILQFIASSTTQWYSFALSNLAGTLPVSNGGTGLTSGTQGGIPYFSASGTIASSAALTQNALLIGGGASAAPATTTTGTGVVTAIGNNTNSASGLAVLNTSGILNVAQGGTGLSSLTSGYVPYGNGTSAFGGSTNFYYDATNNIVGLGTSSLTVYDTNSAADTGAAWKLQTTGSGSAKFIGGSNSSIIAYCGWTGTNAASKSIVSAAMVGAFTSITSGSETGVLTMNVKPSTDSAINNEMFRADGNSKTFGFGLSPSGSSVVEIKAGTSTVAPIKLTAGTNLTTAVAGAIEYDGTVPYFSMAASTRCALPGEQLVILGTAYTLTSQTAAQKLFNATTNGAITLPVGTYQFECVFSLSSMSATSGSFGFALGVGTAVIGSQGWYAFAQKGTATVATATAGQISYNTTANTALATSSTNTVGYAVVRGFFRVTTAGTIIPQVSLGVAAAAVVGAQSYFKCSAVSSTNAAATNITIGNWS